MSQERHITVCGCYHCFEPKDNAVGSHREWVSELASPEAVSQLKAGETIQVICGAIRCSVVADGCLGRCRERPRALLDGQNTQIGTVVQLQEQLEKGAS